jgi:anti-sigma factor RsiW
MDCSGVSSRIAAFLDGELAPADCERFTLHIEACESCAQIVVQLEAQRFLPLDCNEKVTICGRVDFWGDMDSVLSTHMDQMVLAKTACLGPWHKRRVGMPIPLVVAYAAAMLLAVAWGVQQRDRAQTAELSSEHLGQQLEQERRLAAQPSTAPNKVRSGGTYKVVTYTPERGTF